MYILNVFLQYKIFTVFSQHNIIMFIRVVLLPRGCIPLGRRTDTHPCNAPCAGFVVGSYNTRHCCYNKHMERIRHLRRTKSPGSKCGKSTFRMPSEIQHSKRVSHIQSSTLQTETHMCKYSISCVIAFNSAFNALSSIERSLRNTNLHVISEVVNFVWIFARFRRR